MKATVSLRYPKHFITSKNQMMTSGGLMFQSFEQKKSWYKDIAKRILAKSQTLVPVKTGLLKSSGKIKMNNDGTYRVEYNQPYAIYVHEILENKHEYPTQCKYLEDAGYLVLEDLYMKTGNITPIFTFHMEMSISNGVILYIDNVSMADFLGWVKNTRILDTLDDLD